MRLKLAGKVTVYVLVLAGLYALWTRVPDRFRHPRRHWAANGIRIPVPHGLQEVGKAAGAPAMAGSPVVAFAGIAPPVLPLIAHGDTRTVECQSSRDVLDRLNGGQVNAAVVDLPSVVFAARNAPDGEVPFRVVLLVGWRSGSDVVLTSDPGGWRPGQRMAFIADTSGEYLAERTLDAMRWSPSEKAVTRGAFIRWDGNGPIPPGADALAGRFSPRRPWTVWRSTSGDDVADRMPDVLVVSEAMARRAPGSVTRLVAAWVRQQSVVAPGSKGLREFAARHAGPDRRSAVEMGMAPASLEDQRAFLGDGSRLGAYVDLVVRQMRTMEGGGPRPPDVPNIRVDRQPFMDASRPLVG